MKRRDVSYKQNYQGLFQDWEIETVEMTIRRFQKQWKCLPEEDFEDLLQECLLHWLKAKDKYEGKQGASLKTYLTKVCTNKLMDIIREKTSDKREINTRVESLNRPICEDDDSTELIDIIDKDGLVDENFDTHELTELNIQISQVYMKLDPKQIQICEYSKQGYSKVEIARILGIRRTTLQDEFKRIKRIFEQKGLEDYLK